MILQIDGQLTPAAADPPPLALRRAAELFRWASSCESTRFCAKLTEVEREERTVVQLRAQEVD